MAAFSSSIARFYQSTTADQRRVAAYHYVDRLTLEEIAELENVSRATVCRRLEAYDLAMKQMDVVMPPRPAATTRHVRNISPRLMRAL